jgi:hypothetical protein
MMYQRGARRSDSDPVTRLFKFTLPEKKFFLLFLVFLATLTAQSLVNTRQGETVADVHEGVATQHGLLDDLCPLRVAREVHLLLVGGLRPRGHLLRAALGSAHGDVAALAYKDHVEAPAIGSLQRVAQRGALVGEALQLQSIRGLPGVCGAAPRARLGDVLRHVCAIEGMVL